MIRVFVDTSVLFAASYSSSGASRQIIRLALQGEVELVISDDVIKEAERNLITKLPAALEVFRLFVQAVPFDKVSPSADEVQQAASYTAAKDSPIVAAAISAGVDYLVSLDRRHLVGQQRVAQGSGLKIVLPEDFLRALSSQKQK